MKKTKPIRIITLDTETYNGLIGGLKRIAIYDGNNVIYGNSFEDVEPHMINLSKDYKVICYIHNMEFDLRKIPCVFDESRIKWSGCFLINNKLAKVTCKHYTFQDSFKILPMSLSKLSKDFDVEHGKLNLWDAVKKRYPNTYHDIVDFLDRCDKDDDLYLEYLGYDVISLYEVIYKLMEVAGLSEKEFTSCPTTASLSRYIFKNGYKGQKFKDIHNFKTDYQIMTSYDWKNTLEQEEFVRCSYCGGRTEVFKILSEKPLYHYDVNSLYPYVMLGEFPVGTPTFFGTSSLAEEEFNQWLTTKRGLGFISCDVYIPMQNVPPLPVKKGKLMFPCGHMSGVFTYEELEYSMKHCGLKITAYHHAMTFKRTFPIFKRFIETFSKIKEEATIDKNIALRTLAKLLQNVGYGYTGMRRDNKTSIDSIHNMYKYEDGEVVSVNSALGFIEIKQEVHAPYIQVQIASYVTSRARLILLDALRHADAEGDIYYCDTDSIVTDILLPEIMVDDVKLGKWALESCPVKGIFLKPKVYAEVFETDNEKAKKAIEEDYNIRNNYLRDENDNYFKVDKKFKGITRDTQTQLSFYDYESLLIDMQDETKKFRVMEKNKLMMRSISYLKKKARDLSDVEYRDKQIALHPIEKRIIDFSDNKTMPYYFQTLEEFYQFTFSPKKKFIEFNAKEI